jgi:hypothetical protein
VELVEEKECGDDGRRDPAAGRYFAAGEGERMGVRPGGKDCSRSRAVPLDRSAR